MQLSSNKDHCRLTLSCPGVRAYAAHTHTHARSPTRNNAACLFTATPPCTRCWFICPFFFGRNKTTSFRNLYYKREHSSFTLRRNLEGGARVLLAVVVVRGKDWYPTNRCMVKRALVYFPKAVLYAYQDMSAGSSDTARVRMKLNMYRK